MHRSHFIKAGLVAGLFSVLFSATVFAAPVLKLNSSGRDVMLLQQKLQNVGYTIKDIDGIFGEETQRVVTQFQKDNNLRATGVVNNAMQSLKVAADAPNQIRKLVRPEG